MSKEAQILEEIDRIVSHIKVIPEQRNYWLIRTQSGQYYNSFRKNNFVAIEHEEISIYDLHQLNHKYKQDEDGLLDELRILAAKKYPKEKRPGLIANQLVKFVNGVKKGDIVIIPSYNSYHVSIGEVTNTALLEISNDLLKKTECPYKKRKSVKWIKDLSKENIDPYLYKMLQAHQAINNISNYGDIIERSYHNFYIKNNIANLVLEVDQHNNINAKDLFGLGFYLLDYAQNFFSQENLALSTEEIDVKINLNSRGKIHLKDVNARTLWLVALLVVGVNGGGLKLGNGWLDLSTDGVIRKVIDYQNNAHDRKIVDSLTASMVSLKVKTPEDAVKVLQQFSANKNNPK